MNVISQKKFLKNMTQLKVVTLRERLDRRGWNNMKEEFHFFTPLTYVF